MIDPDGHVIDHNRQAFEVGSLRETTIHLPLTHTSPELWSPDSPVLYTVRSLLKENGKVIDEVVTRCGFREIRFDKDTGFWLNGENIKLKGVCNHQDHAGVGVAIPDALWEFRLRLLKDMGVNAYRCAHNPVAKEFMDACDSLGIMVMDENRIFNTSPEYVRQLEWLVRRDRNRPSVILWSVFNEEPMQGTENGYEMVRRMYDVVKKLDTTRPVTAAMNGGLFNEINVAHAVDVVGFNYQADSYDRFREENPGMCLTSAEDGSAFMTRGGYVTDREKREIDSYDTQHARWGLSHRATWKEINERPWLAGGFYWTGFDYRGEPTPYSWPSANSFFGILDLCGFPKAAAYIHRAHWKEEEPLLQLIPHWNWPSDSIGRPIQVMAISNVDSLVLRLNGKLVSGQKADKYEMNTWEVPYEPGKLEVVGYNKNRKRVIRSIVETTGEPVAVQLTPYRSILRNDGEDALPVTVEVIDQQGRHVPVADNLITFEISGPAKIIGLGNGDPNSHEPEKGDKRALFNGLAQVIIQSDPGGEEGVTLVAYARGLKSARLTLQSEKALPPRSVAVENIYQSLTEWIHSPRFYTSPPDVMISIEENDMNTWVQSAGITRHKAADGNYMIYRTTFQTTRKPNWSRSQIVCKDVQGKAEVWLNGERVAAKKEYASADIVIECPVDRQNYDLRLLLEAQTGDVAGFDHVTVSGLNIQ